MLYFNKKSTNMTLEDNVEVMEPRVNVNQMDVMESLMEILVDSHADERITYGLRDSATVLEKRPSDVLLCILPEVDSRKIQHMFSTLIQAFCLENDISLMRVESSEKLCGLISGIDSSALARPETDFHCLLVQKRQNGPTNAEREVLHFCRVTCDIIPYPVVALGP